ncbi:uncharacterized protein AMSG_02153 [Thecamonas trahens ATCC 50062]|uniref:Fungal lipase-type domain-containing protein n=1 Tax=Thecamonas trahens ATCC 50062 TaxID=461836 RepID=A0A0L0DX89_THETB|nr:hypothetical protein AMSG_02153 [Thecamonas trahens ATCC 50062]KNC56138.1 hypothetical protein AMSG_02153 [Thecamonas trahens ATCC 50062]|eukprot:XP_013761177.1 hypothetical protein AMSG_02153 [Thecamonas trahens ATCC 50062]
MFFSSSSSSSSTHTRSASYSASCSDSYADSGLGASSDGDVDVAGSNGATEPGQRLVGVMTKGARRKLLARQMVNSAKQAKLSLSLSELIAGMYYLKKHHRATRPRRKFKRAGRKTRKVAADALHYAHLAFAVYCADEADLELRLEEHLSETPDLTMDNVVEWSRESHVNAPGYMIVNDPNRKEILVVMRGTNNLNDVLTDISAAAVNAYGGEVHEGFYQSTQWFLRKRKKTILKLLDRNPGYMLKVTGHSLGGATAAMIALDLRPSLGKQVSAVVFAPAAGFSAKLAKSTTKYVTSFILNEDVVPRFSSAHLECLALELKAFPWKDLLAAHAREARRELGKNFTSVIAAVRGDKPRREAKAVHVKLPKKRPNAAKLIKQSGLTPLYPPGYIYHLIRDDTLAERDPSALVPYFVRKVGKSAVSNFSSIDLADSMIDDHRMGNYIAAIEQVLDPSLASKPDVVADASSVSSSESSS